MVNKKKADTDVASQRSRRSASSVTSAASAASKKVVANAGRVAAKAVKAVARPFKRLRKGSGVSGANAIEIASDDEDVDEAADDGPSAEQSEDDEAELERVRSHWTSPVYSFFKTSVEIRYDNGRKYQWFPCAATPCKGHGGVKRYQDKSDANATGNLLSHARRCFGQEFVDQACEGKVKGGRSDDIRAAFARMAGASERSEATSRPLSNKQIRVALVRWLTEACRPVALVLDRMFQMLMKSGRPHAEIPSPRTVSRDIDACFEACRARIDQILKDHPGLVHITTDAWTSPNHRAFVAFVAHVASEGRALAFLLDIIEVPSSHTGAALAKAFQDMLIEHDLQWKILGVTCDNATANDVQVRELASFANSFDETNRIRCYNHTLNLAVKALLKPFSGSPKKKKKGGASGNNDGPPDGDASGTAPTSLDEFTTADPELGGELDFAGGEPEDVYDVFEDRSDVDSDNGDDVEASSEEKAAQLAREIAAGRDTVLKLRDISFKIVNSPTIILPAWREACAQADLSVRMIPRPVDTRWNSTFDMLEVSLKYRKAIDTMTDDRMLKLRQHELTDQHWKIVADLVKVLEIFKKQTLFFSQDNVPTIANVLPSMRKISSMLETVGDSSPLHPSVHAALEHATTLMNRYQSYTSASDIYCVSMTLHPLWKTSLRQLGWSQDKVDSARAVTRRIFSAYRAAGKTWNKAGNTAATTRSGTPASSSDSLVDNFDFMMLEGVEVEEQDELDVFLATPSERVEDPLIWWWDHRQAYPTLSMMAMDYLSVPATSTAVERVFSHGRRLIHFTRNRLAASAIRAFLCLGTWGRKNMLRDSDLLDAISPSGKRKRAESNVVEVGSD